jgi:hypothetical protein
MSGIEKHNDSASDDAINRITDNEDLLSIMIDVENYFDNNNLYVFKHWIDGEVIGGPFVKRYWVKIILKYPYKKMPDPNGGLRLLKHGTKIHYDIKYEERPVEIKSPSDYRPGTKKPKMKKHKIWVITLLIPRRFVQNLDSEIMDIYNDEVDVNTVDDSTGEQQSNPNQANQDQVQTQLPTGQIT